MAPYAILVVEDDADINGLLCRILEREGYRSTAAYAGSEAMLLLQQNRYDLVLLDLMLPGVPGEQLVQAVRDRQPTPIIVISARTALSDKVELLRLGADDYITKPFEVEEVTARVAAQLRRAHAFAPQGQEVLRCGALELYPDRREATVNGQPLALTAREFDILTLLLRTPQRVFTRQALYEAVWREAYAVEDNTVNVHISNIRQKLQKLDPAHTYIDTVWGIGFKLHTPQP